ncbi:MAG TPA: hypothetical protein VLA93_02705 [Pyrinomonadaceae bacterium]|nr:hypothetical protein [Pyrinomonadaceae bacterium]
MHNCKATRDLITELLSDGTSAPTQELLIELRCCRECRQEFETLKDTLRLTASVIEIAAPTEEYWSEYHRTLKEKLLASRGPVVSMPQASWFVRMFRTSIHVPVPIAVAIFLMFGVALFFATRAATPTQPETPSLVRVPVEVPVIQDRIVTRIVYRDRYRPPVSRKQSAANDQSALARSQKHEITPASLVGFKPLEEIKLTVIKGGTGNEK